MANSVVVMGGGQGGLVAAIYARLRGFDVTLLEQSDRLGGKAAPIEIAGYRLDPGPSIIILPRIYESVFQDAGRRMSDYLTFRRLDPISRVFFEDRSPIDLPADRRDCERLVQEIAPEDAASFRELMGRLDRVAPHIDRSVFRHPYDHSWQLADPHLIATALQFDVRKTYKELVDAAFRSPLLRAFFYGFPSYGGQTYDSKAPGALMIPYFMLEEGVFYPEGGVAAIPAAFGRLARELGVTIRTGVRIAGLREREGQVVAAQTTDGETISADAFVSNVDRSTTRAWLGEKETASPSLSYFTMHMGIPRVMPELRHHTLVIPKGYEEGFADLYRDRKFPSPPIVYLNLTSESDSTVAPAEKSNLFAVVTSPAEESHLDWTRAEGFREGTLRVLNSIGLDLNPSEFDFERVQTPRYFAEAHGNYRGSLYGVDEKQRPFGGLFPHRVKDEKYRNLFYAGGSVQPGAGLPMVTLSGRFAAHAVKKT